MASELSRAVRRATFGLLILASAATEVAAAETRPVLSSLGLAAIWVGVAAMLGLFARKPRHQSAVPPRYVSLLILLLGAAPFIIEPLRRRWTGDGYPLELQMVFALRNLGLGLAAFAVWPLCLRSASVVSLFLILFSATLTNHPAVLWLIGLYSAAGSVWLLLVYWSGVQQYLAVPRPASVERQADPRSLPWLTALIALGVVGCVFATVALGPQRLARVLGEWLPTSGGTGDFDLFARGGLNDGDDQMRGNNPRSTGIVETDLFLDSALPSLYDITNDLYGKPFKPKAQERAIPLDGRKVKENKKSAHNQRPSREFSTARRGPQQLRQPSDRAARALFEVQGRTPLHVRAAAFDAFDGVSWQEAALNLKSCLLDKEPDSLWMRVQERRSASIFVEAEEHRFKITGSFGALVPTPPHLTRFRVGRVDQANFFAWSQDRILRMAQRQTPSGIIVDTESRTVDPRLLAQAQFPSAAMGDYPVPGRYTALPTRFDEEVSSLAHHWADGKSRGWAQIAAVVQHLRAEYIHDPRAHAANDSADPLADFLLHARRGPDYQFATAAALLLRVLGYPTRLVCGFYVSPGHYDPLTAHTPVVQEDLHFWTEARLLPGDWLVLEPTPGYEILQPRQSWRELALAAALALADWLGKHVVAVIACLIGLAVLSWKNRELRDLLAVTLWYFFPGQSWQACVRYVLWLLERRGRWAGHARPPAQTPSTWLRTALPAGTHRDALQQLAIMAEWCAYAPDLIPPWHAPEVQMVCRRCLDDCSLRHWRLARTACRIQGGCS
jgi:transglutaminase-like putative cysteine protease